MNTNSRIQKDNEEVEKTDFKDNRNNGREILEENVNSKKEIKQQIQGEIEENDDLCNRCKEKLDEEWKKPHWKWNLDQNIRFCLNCYKIKEKEYEKILNYCVVCDTKLKFLRYNPKPEWKIKGQLCRKCWDSKNTDPKSEK